MMDNIQLLSIRFDHRIIRPAPVDGSCSKNDSDQNTYDNIRHSIIIKYHDYKARINRGDHK